MINRSRLLIAIAAVLMLALNAWAYCYLDGAEASALRSAAALHADRILARDISLLRNQKTAIGTHELPAAEFAKQIEAGTRAAQLPATSILRIAPEAARRVGDSPFLDKPTQVLLKNVSLAQLFSFLSALDHAEPRLQARSIHLSTPREDASAPQWSVELDLAYRIFAPKAKTASKRSSP